MITPYVLSLKKDYDKHPQEEEKRTTATCKTRA